MLRVLTWNAWFNEEVELQPRMEALARHAAKTSPDVLALQEVTPRMLELLSAPLRKAGFTVVDQPHLKSPYFVVLCVSDRLRLKSSDFHAFASSVMGRGVFMLSAVLGDLKLEIGTCHLESHVCRRQGATQAQTISAATARRAQMPEALAALERRCARSGASAICLGDFSWCSMRDGCAPGETAGERWHDAWRDVNEAAATAGFTYDARASPMLRGGSSTYQARPDRVLYTGARLTVRSARLVGTASLPGLQRSATDARSVLPSDHFGVLVEFSLKRRRADASAAAMDVATMSTPSSLKGTLHCTQCDLAVVSFEDRGWHKSIDYLFFRLNYPDEDKLEPKFVSRPEARALCCGCTGLTQEDSGAPLAHKQWIRL